MVYWNIGTAIIAAAVSLAIGFSWYGPLFGKLWIKLTGITTKQIAEAKKKSMAGHYVAAFLGSFVMAMVLDMLFSAIGISTVWAGLAFGVLIWVGFMLTLTLSSVLWEGKSLSLYILNNAYNLVNVLIMSAIVATW